MHAPGLHNTWIPNLEVYEWEALISARAILTWWSIETIQQHISLVSMYDRYCVLYWLDTPTEMSAALDILYSQYNIPPVISYENLVLLNQRGKKPTYAMSDEHQADELFFYEIHQKIEVLFYGILEIIENIYNESSSDTESELSELWKKLSNIMRLMMWLRKNFTKWWFDALRPYWDLSEHPRVKESWEAFPWPSWAYSCGFIYLDMAIWKINPDTEHLSLDDEMLPQISWNWYITTRDISRLKETVRDRWNLWFFLSWNPKIHKIIEELKKVRQWHMGLAKKYVWKDALRWAGTWWAPSAWEFLEEHIERTATAAHRTLQYNT